MKKQWSKAVVSGQWSVASEKQQQKTFPPKTWFY
jgi:hypothetical protein